MKVVTEYTDENSSDYLANIQAQGLSGSSVAFYVNLVKQFIEVQQTYLTFH